MSCLQLLNRRGIGCVNEAVTQEFSRMLSQLELPLCQATKFAAVLRIARLEFDLEGHPITVFLYRVDMFLGGYITLPDLLCSSARHAKLLV